MTVHPIEAESYRILAERVDLRSWPEPARTVVARMVHATADVSFADSAVVPASAVRAALDALRKGAPVIADAAMVAAGIPRLAVRCYLPAVPQAEGGATRSALAIRVAAAEHPDGGLWVIGNAPTALFELLDLQAAGLVRPAAVVGLPVGFVGAAESKAALAGSPLAPVAITNRGERGGSPVAAATVNALLRLLDAQD